MLKDSRAKELIRCRWLALDVLGIAIRLRRRIWIVAAIGP